MSEREKLIEVMAQAMSVADESRCLTYDEIATAALTALEAAGVRLVPAEGTPAMWQAAQINSEAGAYVCSNWAEAYQCIEELYRAMLAASPYAPAEG